MDIPQVTGSAAASPPPGAIRVPPLNPEDTNKFASLFDKSGSTNGVIPGAHALSFFYILG